MVLWLIPCLAELVRIIKLCKPHATWNEVGRPVLEMGDASVFVCVCLCLCLCEHVLVCVCVVFVVLLVASVLASMRWAVVWSVTVPKKTKEKKTTSVIQKNVPRREFIPNTVLINSKKFKTASNYEYYGFN